MRAYLDGMLVYFCTPHPKYSESEAYLLFGFIAGRWIAGWHLTEILIKRRLDYLKIKYGKTHNLLGLFSLLPPDDRNSVESKLKKVNNEKPIHDYNHLSVDELLRFLNEQHITKVKYFWQYGDTLQIPIAKLTRLVEVLFIELKVRRS